MLDYKAALAGTKKSLNDCWSVRLPATTLPTTSANSRVLTSILKKKLFGCEGHFNLFTFEKTKPWKNNGYSYRAATDFFTNDCFLNLPQHAAEFYQLDIAQPTGRFPQADQ